MKKRLTLLAQAVPFAVLAAGADAVPEWLRLVPSGEFRAVDGRGPWRVTDAQAVLTASAALLPLPLDENHSTDHALRNGGSAPARGWITELSARADGIWGRVEWTPSGRALMADHSYRGLSPVLEHTPEGAVLRIMRAALTNAGAVPELTILTTQENTVDLTALRSALGLAADADETAILTAAQAGRAAQTAQQATLTRIATVVGLGADAGADAIVTTLTARAAAGDPAALVTQVQTLETRLATLTQAQNRAAAEALVDGAIRDGKPITALRDIYIARGTTDLEAVRVELTKLPSVNGGGIVRPPTTEGGGNGLDADEARIVAMLGVDPEAFKKARAKAGVQQGVI
jgi:phage I-like protein